MYPLKYSLLSFHEFFDEYLSGLMQYMYITYITLLLRIVYEFVDFV